MMLYAFGITCACILLIVLMKKKIWPSAAERANAAKRRHRRILSGGDGSAEFDESIALSPTHSD